MARAHCVDAVRTQKFFFRKHIAPLEDKEGKKAEEANNAEPNGKSGEECFPCRARVRGTVHINIDSFHTYRGYLY